MNVELPNGMLIEGVPDGTPPSVIMKMAIDNGLAVYSDFYEDVPVNEISSTPYEYDLAEQSIAGIETGLNQLTNIAGSGLGLVAGTATSIVDILESGLNYASNTFTDTQFPVNTPAKSFEKGFEAMTEVADALTYEPKTTLGREYAAGVAEALGYITEPFTSNPTGFKGRMPSKFEVASTLENKTNVPLTKYIQPELALAEKAKFVRDLETARTKELVDAYQKGESTALMESAYLKDISEVDKTPLNATSLRNAEQSLRVIQDLNKEGYKGGVGMVSEPIKDVLNNMGIDKSTTAKIMSAIEKVGITEEGQRRVGEAVGTKDVNLVEKRKNAINRVIQMKESELDNSILKNTAVKDTLKSAYENLRNKDFELAKENFDSFISEAASNYKSLSIEQNRVILNEIQYFKELVNQVEKTVKKGDAESRTGLDSLTDLAKKSILPGLGYAATGPLGAIMGYGVRKGINTGLSTTVNKHLGNAIKNISSDEAAAKSRIKAESYGFPGGVSLTGFSENRLTKEE